MNDVDERLTGSLLDGRKIIFKCDDDTLFLWHIMHMLDDGTGTEHPLKKDAVLASHFQSCLNRIDELIVCDAGGIDEIICLGIGSDNER